MMASRGVNLALSAVLLTVPGWAHSAADTSAAAATHSDATILEIPDDIGDADAGGAEQQAAEAFSRRRAALEANQQHAHAAHQARVERAQAAQQQALKAKAASVPLGLSDIHIAFKIDGSASSDLSRADVWGSAYSGTAAGDGAVLAKVQGRDANGQLVDVPAEWTPADPEAVKVSREEGGAVKLIVRRVGSSNVNVVAPGYSTDVWILASAEGDGIRLQMFQ